jgi:peptidyl-prolyl cis-trans isomerase SurA
MKFSLLLTLAAALVCAQVNAQNHIANGVAVKVNDAIITWKEVHAALADKLEFLERVHGHQPDLLVQKRSELVRETLDELIERQLILHEYHTKGYNLPESFIQDRINRDTREFGDRATLTKTLHARGLTREAYRKQVRENIIIQAMVAQNVPHDPVISPSRIQSYYSDNLEKFQLGDQVKLRMIVLPNRGGSQRKLADEILAKIQEGTSFAEMARIYSQGSQREQGGDWGWIEKSVLREDLAEIAFSSKPGQVSEVIESSDACYIMLVEETRPAHVRPLSEVRNEIEETLKTEEHQRLRQQWLERLHRQAFIRFP